MIALSCTDIKTLRDFSGAHIFDGGVIFQIKIPPENRKDELTDKLVFLKVICILSADKSTVFANQKRIYAIGSMLCIDIDCKDEFYYLGTSTVYHNFLKVINIL